MAHRTYGTYPFHTGIAGTVYAGGTVEGFHLKASVVGKAVDVIMVVNVVCFLQRVFFQCLSCLRDIDIAANILQRQHLYPIAENLSHFLQFVLIVGCEYYFHFPVLF